MNSRKDGPREWLFGGNREKAIQRDGEKCVKCGMTRAEHRAKYGRDITVDHIDKNGINKPPHLKNSDLSNLQTLCLPCHVSKDNPRWKNPCCPHGHPYSGSNLYITPEGSRQCRICRRTRVIVGSRKEATWDNPSHIHTCCGSRVPRRHKVSCPNLSDGLLPPDE